MLDNSFNKDDIKLLDDDKYTFNVLCRIMYSNCQLTLTDHKRLIICSSSDEFPVWIWTPDDATKEEMEYAYNICDEYNLLGGKYRFVLKYELANYFISRAKLDNKDISIFLNMYAYDCNNPIKPDIIADGSIHQCNDSDLDELVDFIDCFHKDIGIDKQSIESYKKVAKEYIDSGTVYFWQNNDGKMVASTKYTIVDNLATINLVYTKKEYRRMHYANNLVYEITKMVKDMGYIPMLYTNADYIASNACYEKIGYVLKGKLCNIMISIK